MPPPLFNPSPELTQVLLERLAAPNHSLTTIAADHDTTLEALVLWATRPDIAERQRAIKGYAAERSRTAAISCLHTCVEALATSLHAYIKDEHALPAAYDAPTALARDRLRSGARRSSWHIQRIARAHPELVPAELLGVVTPASSDAPDRPARRIAPQPDATLLTTLAAAAASNPQITAFLGAFLAGFTNHAPAAADPDRGTGFQPVSTAPSPSATAPADANLNPSPLPSAPTSTGNTKAIEGALRTQGTSRSAHPSSDIPDLRSPPPDAASGDPDRPSDSATAILSTRSVFDTPTDNSHASTLADVAGDFRKIDPGARFNEPYRIPDRHVERLEKAGRCRPPPRVVPMLNTARPPPHPPPPEQCVA